MQYRRHAVFLHMGDKGSHFQTVNACVSVFIGVYRMHAAFVVTREFYRNNGVILHRVARKSRQLRGEFKVLIKYITVTRSYCEG